MSDEALSPREAVEQARNTGDGQPTLKQIDALATYARALERLITVELSESELRQSKKFLEQSLSFEAIRYRVLRDGFGVAGGRR